MAVWPYEPEARVVETVFSRGEVIKAASQEMRASFHPAQRIFQFDFPLSNNEALQALETIRTAPLTEIEIPIWTERQSVDVDTSDTTITCDVNASFAADKDVIVWSSADNYTTATIDSVGASSITLTTALGASHPNGVLMPLGSGYVRQWSADRRGRDITVLSGAVEVTNLPDLDPGAEISQFPLTGGLPVIGNAYAMVNRSGVSIYQPAEWVEDGYGSIDPSSTRSVIEEYHTISLHMTGATERHALLKLLHSLRGRDGAFWAVEPGGNIPIIGQSSGSVTIPKIAADPNDLQDRYFQTDAGTVRQVTSASDLGDNQVLSIATLSETTQQIYMLRKYRADTDAIDISHIPRADSARASFSCMEVPA